MRTNENFATGERFNLCIDRVFPWIQFFFVVVFIVACLLNANDEGCCQMTKHHVCLPTRAPLSVFRGWVRLRVEGCGLAPGLFTRALVSPQGRSIAPTRCNFAETRIHWTLNLPQESDIVISLVVMSGSLVIVLGVQTADLVEYASFLSPVAVPRRSQDHELTCANAQRTES